jgi:hypothetical protein
MARNMLSEHYLTQPCSHFPDGPGMTISSQELRPIVESLPDYQQDAVAATVRNFDPRGGDSVYEDLAEALGVQVSVAYGVMTLLHPEA